MVTCTSLLCLSGIFVLYCVLGTMNSQLISRSLETMALDGFEKYLIW